MTRTESLKNKFMKILPDVVEIDQATLEEVRKVKRTELFKYILSIVKQIPRKDVEGDAMDAPSCAYEIEQIFYKWQQERMYSEEEMLEHLNHLIMIPSSELDKFTDDEGMVTMKWFEQFKKE